jgi:type IV pilus assembly protein PilN
MNISLNLATKPYVELRAVYSRLRLFAVVLAVVALPLMLILHFEDRKAEQAEARVVNLQQKIAALHQQQDQARRLASEGPNAHVLAQAAFLNGLFRHKAFSWTATMSDLETTLPVGVQVGGIEPIMAPDGRVTIRLRVSGARDRTVDVIRNLEHSRHFIAPRLVAEGLSDQNGSRAKLVNTGAPQPVSFDIIAGYRPLSRGEQAMQKEARQTRGTVAASDEQGGTEASSDAEEAARTAGLPVAARPAVSAARKPYAGKPSAQGGR